MSLSLTAVKGPAELQSCQNSRTCGADVGRCTGPKLEGRLFTTVNTGSCQNTLRMAAAPRLERGPVPPLSTLPSFLSSTNDIRPQRCLPRRHLSPARHVTQSFSFNLRPTPAGNRPQTDGHTNVLGNTARWPKQHLQLLLTGTGESTSLIPHVSFLPVAQKDAFCQRVGACVQHYSTFCLAASLRSDQLPIQKAHFRSDINRSVLVSSFFLVCSLNVFSLDCFLLLSS